MESDIYSKELAHYFDMLRVSRKMTLEDLTHEIVSIRQFRRYIRGEYQMPQIVFNKLSTRLGFKPEHVLLEFENVKLAETKKMNTLHNLVVNKDFQAANLIIRDIDENFIIEQNNLIMFKFSKLLMDYYLENISPENFIDEIKILIHYDSLFEKSILSSTEVILLTSLLPTEPFREKDKVIKLLENFLNKQKTIVSGHNDRLILLCLYYVSDYYGTQGKFEDVIKFCKKGIEYCNYLRYTYLLQDFYYFSALAYYYLNKFEQYEMMLYRCYCVLNAEDNEAKQKNYYQMIEEDFNIQYEVFIKEYLENRIKKAQ
ncbi:hypothetical protein [Acholeplasma hippikon]|uniref:HTH cro/C1-type domain-containing protein n=1 Tax=Acholeplasma hippikon TaxID=264636 RepID=A0A449BIT3_9MOLU|nr:hypothetical protein [Acholeplasma hippikon]VEU82227.1 Uncharacterised protein [Acholeplasma hippikon]